MHMTNAMTCETAVPADRARAIKARQPVRGQAP